MTAIVGHTILGVTMTSHGRPADIAGATILGGPRGAIGEAVGDLDHDWVHDLGLVHVLDHLLIPFAFVDCSQSFASDAHPQKRGVCLCIDYFRLWRRHFLWNPKIGFAS